MVIKKAWYFVFCWMWYGVGLIIDLFNTEQYRLSPSPVYSVNFYHNWLVMRSKYLQRRHHLTGQTKRRDIPVSATKYWPYDYNE